MSKRPVANTFDSLATKDAKKVESRQAYEKSHAPASTYKTPSGNEVKIDPKDRQIDHLRGQLDHAKWVNRNQREDLFYHSYSSRPLIVYNDCYHPYWNYYLMSRPIDDIAMWVYMHQMTMDATRLNWYYSQNSDLRVRVAALEARRLQRDPAWVPNGIDPDLAYNDNYVNAAFNPTPKTEVVYHYNNSPSTGYVLMWIFIYMPLILITIMVGYYAVFVYRW